MMSIDTFAGLIDNITKIKNATNRLCDAIGFGSSDCEYDACTNAMIDVIINELQNEMDKVCENSHIDVGEIFINWYDYYCYNYCNKSYKAYVLKIDDDEYRPETPYDFYNMITNHLFEEFAKAKFIDY